MADRLRQVGYDALFLDFDPDDGIAAGRDWERKLYTELRACRGVIVLCSAHSMASDWCFAEIAQARAAAGRAERARPAPRFVLLQAQLSLQLADWRAALGAADRLLERTAAADAGSDVAYRAGAQAVRGIALARLGRLQAARPALAIAAADERHAAEMRPWLDYVERLIVRPRPDDG